MSQQNTYRPQEIHRIGLKFEEIGELTYQTYLEGLFKDEPKEFINSWEEIRKNKPESMQTFIEMGVKIINKTLEMLEREVTAQTNPPTLATLPQPPQHKPNYPP